MCAAVYRQRHLVKAMEVTAGLAESNGSLLPGLRRDSLHVTCRLTACTLGSAPGPMLGNEYGKTLPFLLKSQGMKKITLWQYKKIQKSSWNEPYSSSSFTKQSSSKMALYH